MNRSRIAGRVAPLVSAFVALLLVHAPAVATACTVCGAAADNKNQFIGMTAFLTLLPLCFIGGVVLWLRHKAAESADVGLGE